MSPAGEGATVTGVSGSVQVRVYRPAEATATIVWIHGGSFVGGSLDMSEADAPCRAFAAAGMTAISVGYRLVPGFGSRAQRRPDAVRFPLPLDDCAAAWEWACGDTCTGRILVGGASAGGALATTLVLRARASGTRVPDGVVLAYPLLHAELPALPAEVRRDLRGWRRLGTFGAGAVRWIGRNYVGPHGLSRLAEAFPAPDRLGGFPPTLIVDSERDTLRASSSAFAAALRDHRVPVTHVVEPGTRHGHLDRPGRPAQQRTLHRMVTWAMTI